MYIETNRSLIIRRFFIKKAFNKILPDKKEKIISTAIKEFADKGYSKASLNDIIKDAGISKGGMYKYISSKSELYRYVIDYSLEKLGKHFSRFSYTGASTIKDFLLAYSEHEFAFYSNHPDLYKLHINVFINSDEPIDRSIRDELKQLPESYFNQLMFSIDKDMDEKRLNIYKWVLDGINKKYYQMMMKQNQEQVKDKYITELNDYLTILEKSKTEGK